MHKEAEEELRVRLKLVVRELAHHLGVTKACREFDVPRSSYYRWKQKYEKPDNRDCIEKDPSPIIIPTKHLPKSWRKSWNFAGSINLELCGLSIIWSATMGSRFPNPR